MNKSKADIINEILSEGGECYITTYTRQTRYTKKHTGMFFMDTKGELRVKNGNKSLCLTSRGNPLVAISLYKPVENS